MSPTNSTPLAGVRVLMVVNVDWFFLSHRLPVALGARDAGAQVLIAAADTGDGDRIRAAGLEFAPLPFDRQGRRPLHEARTMAAIARLYRRTRPHLVHHVSVKPVLYGSIVARTVARDAVVVNAISGLGFSFSDNAGAQRLRRLVLPLYRLALGHPRSRTIFQNSFDRDRMISSGVLDAARAVIIRGSGVDCDRFVPRPEPTGPPIVLLASRMLWDKGIEQFVVAAKAVRANHPSARFVLVGTSDPGNPETVPEARLREWNAAGDIEWWGRRADMPDVMAQSTIVTLPTYYPEGVPKVLLEAAATARPIVATDTPGCREAVRHGETGLLVPARDPVALAVAIEELLGDRDRRRRMGAAGRELATREFREELVVADTLRVYEELLAAQR